MCNYRDVPTQLALVHHLPFHVLRGQQDQWLVVRETDTTQEHMTPSPSHPVVVWPGIKKISAQKHQPFVTVAGRSAQNNWIFPSGLSLFCRATDSKWHPSRWASAQNHYKKVNTDHLWPVAALHTKNWAMNKSLDRNLGAYIPAARQFADENSRARSPKLCRKTNQTTFILTFLTV